MNERISGRLTVVIPSYNGRDLLRNCLLSLQRQTRDCAIVVCDDGSSDGTADMVEREFPHCRCLRSASNAGFAKAANRGLRHVETEFAALLNNDTEADPRWVEEGLRGFERYPLDWILASKLIDFHDRSRIDAAGDRYTRSGLPLKRGNGQGRELYGRDEPVLGASAGAAFYRAALFDEIGYLDEAYYMYLEDVDLCLRAQLAGRSCRFLHRAVVYHIEAASDARQGPSRVRGASASARELYSPSRVYWITRNRWQLMWTYQSIRHAPWLLFGWTKSAAFHLLKAGYFRHFLLGSAAGWRCLPRALRKRSQLLRRIAPREFRRLMR